MSTTSSMSAQAAVAGWIDRLRPSCGDAMPLAASSCGVSRVPAATTIRSASTTMRPPARVTASTRRARPPSTTTRLARAQLYVTAPAACRGRPPGGPPGARAPPAPPRAAALNDDPPRARAAVRDGAGGVGGLHERSARVLLGAGRAAERAHARAATPAHVAVQEAAG